MLLVVSHGAFAGETAAPGKIDAKAAFERLKALAGDWQGSTGMEGVSASVIYRVGSNGTIVTETLFPNSNHEMMTVYFLQGDDLVATHYCAAGNQPHFKLDLAKSTPTDLVFAFDGGTGFDAAKDGHVHDGMIKFSGDGKLDTSWVFYAGGERKGANEFHLTRAAK
jgi:hypothetical protein